MLRVNTRACLILLSPLCETLDFSIQEHQGPNMIFCKPLIHGPNFVKHMPHPVLLLQYNSQRLCNQKCNKLLQTDLKRVRRRCGSSDLKQQFDSQIKTLSQNQQDLQQQVLQTIHHVQGLDEGIKQFTKQQGEMELRLLQAISDSKQPPVASPPRKDAKK